VTKFYASHIRELINEARDNNQEKVALLLAKGVPINGKDRYRRTAILKSLMKGHGDRVNFLIAKGIVIKVQAGEGCALLIWAAEKGHKAVVEILLDDRTLARTLNQVGESPLFLPAANRNKDICPFLLNHGAHLKAGT